MAQTVSCPQCGAQYAWRPEFAGQRVRCKCGQSFAAQAPPPNDPPPPLRVFDDAPTDPPPGWSAVAETPPVKPPRALTLGNAAVASNPGDLKVEWRKYLACFPWEPLGLLLLAVGGLAAAAVLAAFGQWSPAAGAAAGAVAAGAFLVFRLRQVHEHFRFGCVVPAVVVSDAPYLIAVYADLGTGGDSYPAIKIMPQPLARMTGGPPAVGARLAAVALFHGNPSAPHWNDCEPLAVACATSNPAEIERLLQSIPPNEWEQLERGLPQVRGRLRRGALFFLGPNV